MQSALAAARKATSLAPEDPESWRQLASVHLARLRVARTRGRDPDDRVRRDALEALDHVEALTGGDVRARIARGRIFGSWTEHGSPRRPSSIRYPR